MKYDLKSFTLYVPNHGNAFIATRAVDSLRQALGVLPADKVVSALTEHLCSSISLKLPKDQAFAIAEKIIRLVQQGEQEQLDDARVLVSQAARDWIKWEPQL